MKQFLGNFLDIEDTFQGIFAKMKIKLILNNEGKGEKKETFSCSVH